MSEGERSFTEENRGGKQETAGENKVSFRIFIGVKKIKINSLKRPEMPRIYKTLLMNLYNLSN